MTSWNFDQGSPTSTDSPYGWFSDDDGEWGAPIYIPYSSSSHVSGSSHGSLGIYLNPIQGSGTRIVSTRPCDAGLNLRGKTVSAWVLRSSVAAAARDCAFMMNWLEPNGQFFVGNTQIGTAANVWVQISGTVPTTAPLVTKVSLSCGTPEGWDGTLYFDDVTISP